MNDATPPSRASELEAVRALLASMGISPADLASPPPEAREAPDFASYVPRVAEAASPGARRVYGPYWTMAVRAWGPRPITSVTATEVSQLAESARSGAVQRRNGRGGRGAAEHLIGALRCLYQFAVADGIISRDDNPAAQISKPRRLLSTRHALPGQRLAEVFQAAAATGDDPALDALLIRLHFETACRRGGALALAPDGLDRDQCLVLLREKGETMRWQPVSPTLMSHLIAHAERRGGLDSGSRLLRYANGRPITRRRYDYLWQRLGEELPWVATQQVSMHWIRHTVLTWVERNFGFAVAQAYAGHEDQGRSARTLATYIVAGLPEVAAALSALTGEPHPLATSADLRLPSRGRKPTAPPD
jgi:site-specific recombinase XerD